VVVASAARTPVRAVHRLDEIPPKTPSFHHSACQ
jgi:hypothetical protein